MNQIETLQAFKLHAGTEALTKVNDAGNAMHAACDAEDNALGIIDFLLSEKIDLNVKNKEGKTPLHLAAESSSYNSLLLIIDHHLTKFEK